MHELKRLASIFPRETRAQDGMSIHHLLPRARKMRCIDLCIKVGSYLLEIHSGPGRVKRMEEDTLLSRREWIEVLDAVTISVLRCRTPTGSRGVTDEPAQDIHKLPGHCLDRGTFMNILTVDPNHLQLFFEYTAIDFYQMGSFSTQDVGRPTRLVSRFKQRSFR